MFQLKKRYFAHLAAFSACIIAFETGICFVWTSPILPKLTSADPGVNPIGTAVTITESAWIVSSMTVALILGPFFSVVGLRYYTKKHILLASMAPLGVSHVVLCWADRAWIFMFARALMGLGTGAAWAVLGSYIAEISEDKNRGFLGSICGITSNLGSLLAYVAGPYLTMQHFSLINLVPVALFYLTFSFMPHSPYDLVSKLRYDLAKRNLETLRQSADVEKEFEFIKETVVVGSKDKVRLRDFVKDKALRKGLLFSVALMACQNFSGIIAVCSYAETIFKVAGNSIPPEYSPMLFSVFSTMSIITSSFLIDKIGRKVLITTSCIIESISLFSLGFYFFQLEGNKDVSKISWLPLSSVILFMVAFNFALGVVPWIVTGEIFHSSVKGIASPITSVSNFLVAFIVTICFPYMVASIGMGWTFWSFAVLMVLGSMFCLVFLPETKGKNFQEIQDILRK
ncbi:facilitated trehalose transporter Tret1-like [Euwallacea fornicatus]|uniref:facilitated trehalose transporter Tret1-like n=1 Tax=Euwallacea fornicatus TaxID=995702 RepID=UPI00338F4492